MLPRPGRPTQFLCLFTGDALPEIYVERLYRMLDKHAPKPFTLTCMVDRKRDLRSEIVQMDISGWPNHRPDMRATKYRLHYFAPETAPLDEFVSIDLTLVVKASLEPLLAFAESRSEALVIVDDWHHPTVNGSLMRVRRGDELRAIYDDYKNGVTYPSKIKGDQDFIDGAIKAHGLQAHMANFPAEMIVSYRNLRRLHRKDPKEAMRKLDEACILKFHGRPRPHEVLENGYWIREALRSPGHVFQDWGFLRDQVREWWCLED